MVPELNHINNQVSKVVPWLSGEELVTVMGVDSMPIVGGFPALPLLGRSVTSVQQDNPIEIELQFKWSFYGLG